MARRKIAVVIPTFRRETRLAFALEALAGQTLDPELFEVVVVRAPGESGPFTVAPVGLEVRFLIAGTKGAASQRNHGWRSATAALIAFTDDDCRPSPTWLADLLAASVGNAVMQGRTEPDPDEAHLNTGLARSMQVTGPDPWHPSCNIAYPRDLLEQLHGFDEGFPAPWGEDTDLGLRASAAGAAHIYVEGALVWHAVLPRALPAALRDARRTRWVPSVVARHPVHRDALFGGVFVNRSHAALALGAVGGLAARRHPFFAGAAFAPYLALHLTEALSGRSISARGVARLALHLPERFAVDAAEVLATIRGALDTHTAVV